MVAARQRKLAWNGIEFPVPAEFQVIVKGPCHLLVEKEFKPLLEIRWERSDTPKNSPKLPDDFVSIALTSAPESLEEKAWSRLVTQQKAQVFSTKPSLVPTGCCWHDAAHGRVVLVEMLAEATDDRLQCLELLAALQQQHQTAHRWAIQDIEVLLPPASSLLHYSFKPGLTRLSFSWNRANLHLCRLAPASRYLARQDLENILRELAAEPDLIMSTGLEDKEIRAHRTARGLQRLRLGLQRRPANLAAFLRLVETEDRLLGLVCSGNHALDYQALEASWQSYGLI